MGRAHPSAQVDLLHQCLHGPVTTDGLRQSPGETRSPVGWFLLGRCCETEPRDLSYLVPVEVLTEVNTAVTAEVSP